MFHSARIKLTAWYVLIIMVISFSFSGVIYQSWRNEVNRFEQAQRERFQRRLENLILPDGRVIQPFPIADQELLEETKLRLLTLLGLINGSILLLAGGLSYFLAGKTLRPIQEMLEDQNRFIGDASHELRTPLTSLKAAFEVYLRDKNKTVKDAEKIIKDSIVEVNHLTSLTNSLLLSVNNQSTIGEDKFTRVLLNEVINESVRRTLPLAEEKKIAISAQLKPYTVNGDQPKLVELFTVLVDNAIKYGRQEGWVKITAQKTDHSVLVNIKDNGKGIPEKDLPNIFDRFYRADESRTKFNGGGFGLGLSIAKQIVQNHRGSIGVESKLGKGSTFIVKLPL